MRREGVAPVEVGAHARDHAHAALLCGGRALAEEIAIVEEFSVAMKRHLRGIEREDAGDADKDDVDFARVPVVGPLFHVHHRGVVLGHVGLAHATDVFLPRFGGGIDRPEPIRQRDKNAGRAVLIGARFLRREDGGIKSSNRRSERQRRSPGGDSSLQKISPAQHGESVQGRERSRTEDREQGAEIGEQKDRVRVARIGTLKNRVWLKAEEIVELIVKDPYELRDGGLKGEIERLEKE